MGKGIEYDRRIVDGLIGRYLGSAWVESYRKEFIMESEDIARNDVIKLRSRVRNKVTKEYLGKVVKLYNVWYVVAENGDRVWEGELEELEIAPELTPETAWSEVTLLIVKLLGEVKSSIIPKVYDVDQREIRHECYKLLGGAGVKVTEDIKERVRYLIKQAAEYLDVRLV